MQTKSINSVVLKNSSECVFVELLHLKKADSLLKIINTKSYLIRLSMRISTPQYDISYIDLFISQDLIFPIMQRYCFTVSELHGQ